MKQIFFCLLLLVPIFASGQREKIQFDPNNLELRIDHTNGLTPVSLEVMAKTSDIILLGRYGRLIRDFDFYGYNQDGTEATVDEISQRVGRYDPDEVKKFSIHMSDYEIIVEEFIKGEGIAPKPLLLRLPEPSGMQSNPELREQRDGEHLFFFILNPGNETVGIPGAMYDMKKVGDEFSFTYSGVKMTAFDSHNSDSFLARLRALVK